MIRLVVLALVLMAGAAVAQTVPVRSGEHPTFSRLVLSLPAATGWRIGREGGAYVLDLDRPLDFALEGVFDRLPAGRIDSLTQVAPGRLRIQPGCDCHVTAFAWEQGRLVVDVVAGPAPPESPFEAALRPTPPAVELPILTARARDPMRAGMPDPFALDDGRSGRLAEAGQALRESVARAATAGLLTPDIGARIATAPRTDPPMVAPPAPDRLAEAAGMPDAGPALPLAAARPGIAFITAPERAQLDLVDQARGMCLPDAQFDVASWAGSDDFATEIGRRRAAILTDAAGLDGPAVEDLARAYLYFGFGLEAEQALAMDNLGSTDRRMLRALSRLVDGHDAEADLFAGQADCPGPVAMWAALSSKSLAGTGDAARIAIEAAHRALPAPLRLHLAAPLAAVFLADGDAATADAILLAARSVDDTPPLDLEMTAAEVELATEGAATAIATLEDLAETDDRMTAEGLVRLMDLTLAQGRAPDDDILALAAAKRFEARGTPAAQALLAAEVRANLLVPDFGRALRLLDGSDADPADAVLRGDVAIAMAERAEPTRFVAAVFGPLAENLTPAAENTVASRLLSLGFAERALALVTPETVGQAMAERRYLRAEAALALGRPLQAEAALTGIDDPRANALRAAARQAEGDFAGALAEAGPTADPALAWRAGDWAAVGPAADPLIAAASAARVDLPADLDAAPPLEARSALLRQSAETRGLAEALLRQFADPDPSSGPGPAPDQTTGG